MSTYLNGNIEYSGQECVIGKWYGKPLYRKVVWSELTGKNVEILHGIEKLDRVVNLHGSGVDKNGANFTIPRVSLTTGNNISIYASREKIILQCNNDMDFPGAYIILEYTKL